jgi:hypothetical protein
MKKISLYILLSVVLISCGKNKEVVFDKCLTQANQTFGNDIVGKAKHLNGCMTENEFRWNAGCYKQDTNDMLSAICYVKKY